MIKSLINTLHEKNKREELERNSGIQFDPELIKIFIEKVLKDM